MKLHELKEATRSMHLPDLDHIFEVGKLAYKMGFERNSNTFKLGQGHDAWVRGYDHAKRAWEDLLRRNGAGGSKLLWMV